MSRAAERLFLSQPAMSGMLSRLRHAFGDELLVRVGRNLEHTDFAVGIAKRVHECVVELEDLLEDASPFVPESDHRAFRISASDYAALLLLGPIVNRLVEAGPICPFTFSSSTSRPVSGCPPYLYRDWVNR